jgi:hypothetical protein
MAARRGDTLNPIEIQVNTMETAPNTRRMH